MHTSGDYRQSLFPTCQTQKCNNTTWLQYFLSSLELTIRMRKKRGKRVNNILVTEDRGKMNAQGKSRSCVSVHVYKQTACSNGSNKQPPARVRQQQHKARIRKYLELSFLAVISLWSLCRVYLMTTEHFEDRMLGTEKAACNRERVCTPCTHFVHQCF